MPSFIAISHTVPCNGNGIWSYILFSHPYIYYLLYFILQFICAGLMATMSLVVSLYVNNAFIVLLFPSVLCEFINAVSTWIPVKYRYIKGKKAYFVDGNKLLAELCDIYMCGFVV